MKSANGRDAHPSGDQSGAAFEAATNLQTFFEPWNAMAGMLTAWIETAQVMASGRGVEAGNSLARLFDPAFWKAGEISPLLKEIKKSLSLPQFSDLPHLDTSMIDTSAAMVDVIGLAQQFTSSMVPLWLSASQRFQTEIAARALRGEPVTSPGEAHDLWNGVIDRAMMEFNRTSEFAKIQQRLLRASAQYKLELRKTGERAAGVFDMPTRTEMTDVYSRMHDMQREMHKLRREIRSLRKTARPQADQAQTARRIPPKREASYGEPK